MTRWLYLLARRCARNGWLVLGIWLLVAIAVMGAHRIIGGAVGQTYNLPGTDSAAAQDLLNRAFPGSATEPVPVVLHDPEADLAAGPGAASVAGVVSALQDMPVINDVVAPEESGLVSEDGHTAVVQVTIADRSAGSPSVGTDILATARGAAPPSMQVELGGFIGNQVSRPNTRISEALGLLAAVLVLLLTLRRVPAVLIPLVNAMLSVGIGLALIGLLGSLVFIPDVAPTLGTMLGLGVGIDYALFLVVRHRTLLRAGYEVSDAVGRTAGTAGAGVVFAGGTLIAAVSGLALTGLSFLAWLGVAAAVVVAVAVVASFTLVPAMLGIAGHRVLPRHMRDVGEVDDEALDRTGWARLAAAVTSRPWRFAIASTAVLLLLAAPTLTLTLGHSDASTLPPETTARKADDLMREAFGAGSTAPLAVVSRLWSVAEAPGDDESEPATSQGSGDPRTSDPRLVALVEDLEAVDGVERVDDVVVSTDGGVAIVRVIPEWGSADPRTEALVHHLRDDVLPAATAGLAMSAHVGGVTASVTDLSELIAARTPWFILGVVSLSFLLLMLAYRSLLIPLKAALMNLLSIAAAYGVVTMVFQWGWGASLIGLSGPVPIESYVPMMMFAVLFGLSMDYEVFLLTAFREHWERSQDMTVAVRRGLADTGRVVTAAALIMVVVFASFVLSTDPLVKMFGVGLATAVAIDATIVRCLLVPAILVLIQKGTWWLPAWLDDLLPHLHVEGDPQALASIGDEHDGAPRSTSARAADPGVRATAVVGAVTGVVLAALLVPRLAAIPVGAGAAVTAAAVLGGVVVLLPGRGRAGWVARVIAYVAGAVLAVVAIAVARSLVPGAATTEGLVAAAGVVVVAAIAVLLIGRGVALPLVLGALGIVVAVTAGPEGALASGTALLVVAVLPALVAAVVATAVTAVLDRARTPAAVDPVGDGPAPGDELLDVRPGATSGAGDPR